MLMGMSRGSSADQRTPEVSAQDGDCIVGTGEMAERIRSFDWASTPLGARENWPETLLSTLNVVLACHIPSALFWGPDLILLYNDAYKPFLSTKHPVSLGRPGSVVWQEAWHIIGPQYEAALRAGQPSLEQDVLIPIQENEQLRDFYWINSISPVYERGQVVGVFNCCQNTTQAVLGARMLRESEMRASRILQSIGDAVIVTDADTRITRINAVAASLTGWTAEEAKGLPLSEVFRVVQEETRLPVESPAEKVRRLGRVVELNNHTVLVCRRGQEIHIDHNGAPIRNDRGELTGIVLVFRDVSARREAEKQMRRVTEALAQSEEELRWTVKLSSQIPWTADTEGRILGFSPSWLELTGMSAEEALGDGWANAPHPQDLPAVQIAWSQAVALSRPYDVEHRVRTALGEYRWMRSRAFPRRNEDGSVMKWYGTTEDIHERKRAEEALLQTEKLAAVGRLASSIAHEINNPLESVTNLLYLAQHSEQLADVQQYLQTAERELRRVSVISNQTLRFHRQSTSPTSVTCEALIETILTIYQARLINARIEVLKRKRSTSAVRCFEGEIRQVLNNLAANAIDAMGAGGTLLIRSRDATHWPTGRKGLAITMADTGSGMERAVLRRIFEPFYTTKGINGTGLGLWISQEIVARHEGVLRARSSRRPGCSGTVFSIFLPFHAAVR